MIQCQVVINKELPRDQIKNWQDKVVYTIARKTLDFTNTNYHFPELTGDLKIASMNQGVVELSKGTYGLGTDGSVDYAGIVWKYGSGTRWTNENTIPQWYMGVFKKYKTEIVDDSIKTANNEVK